MAGAILLDRARWLGYRWQRHGLDGGGAPGVLDDLLLLGVQDNRLGGAAQALALRTDDPGPIGPGAPLVSLWSVRGAPHVHRVGQLDLVCAALAPDDGDEGGPAYAAAVHEVAAALRAVVTGPTPKGEASRQVTQRVSGSLVSWCERCGATHVPDALFRAAGRQARLVLGPEQRRATMLHPPPPHPRTTVAEPRRELLRAYARVNGPVGRTPFRDWMEGTTAGTAALWDALHPLVRVRVDNRRLDLPERLLDAVRQAPPPHGVVLVPAHDPYLRQADRTLLVPDAARRREVFRALSPPGALLVDGEVAGVWRYRRTAGALTVAAFAPLTAGQRTAAGGSAARLTGDHRLRLTWD